jgi:hypothetical protein
VSPHQPVHSSSPHDGGADADVALCSELVVEAVVATVLAEHLTTHASCEHPLVQSSTAHPERIVEALIGSGHVPVE